MEENIMRIITTTLLAMSTMLVALGDQAFAADSNLREGFYLDVKGGTSKAEALKGSFKQSKLKQSALAEVRTGYNFNQFASDLTFTSGRHYKMHSHSIGINEDVRGLDFTHQSRVKFNALTVNGYYNIGPFKGITPYVGLGAGAARTRFGDTKVTFARDGQAIPYKNKKGSTAHNFVWQAMAGLRFTLTPDLELSLEYKYMDLGKVKTSNRYQVTNADYLEEGENPWKQDNVAKGKLRTNNLLVGLRYYF
jgi:opacity protein-like surface antigen